MRFLSCKHLKGENTTLVNIPQLAQELLLNGTLLKLIIIN